MASATGLKVEKRNPFRFARVGQEPCKAGCAVFCAPRPARGLEIPKGTSRCPTKPAQADSDDVRNLAYLALCENDQSSVKSRICEMRRVVHSTWRVFYSFVFDKALGRASHRTPM